MMTIANIFERMVASFNTSAAAGVSKTFQWNVRGEDAGNWAIAVQDGTCQLVPGGVTNPDITFDVVDKDWVAIAEGKLNAVQAFMSGKVKVNGDMMLAMKAQRCFPPGR